MSFNRLIVASVVTHAVFERFAKLSKKDKKKVVEKVKEKVKTKKPAKKKDKKDEKGKKPEKGKIPPQFQKGKKDEEIKEDAMAEEDTSTTGEKPMGDESETGLDGIVDGLVKEIEVIKKDGKVEMSEVMGLIDNMMKMVDTLVKAKPAKQKKASDDMADRVAHSVISMSREENDDWDDSDIENTIRDHLSGTRRRTKERLMYNNLKGQFKGLSSSRFRKIWNELVSDDYLIPIPGGSYVWEM